MNRAYVAFVGILAALWVMMMAIDIAMTLYLYQPNFASLTTIKFPIFVIVPLPFVLLVLPGTFTAIWIGVVAGVVTAFFAIILFKSIHKFESSSLFGMGEFFALNLFLSIVYIYTIEFLGYPIKSPISPSPADFALNFVSLTNAGLYEELIARVAYIGIPLFLYYAWSYNGRRSPSRPRNLKWWRIIWGGGYKFGKPEIVVLVVSSLIFGFAHVSSWDLSKVPQAALGGFLLGALYLRFGLYADVLFHFSVDSPSLLFIQGQGNPLASSGSSTLYYFLVLVFVVAGAVVTVMYIYRATKVFGKRTSFHSHVANPPVKSNTRMCPNCGSTDVNVFSDDYFRCDDCGRLFPKDQ